MKKLNDKISSSMYHADVNLNKNKIAFKEESEHTKKTVDQQLKGQSELFTGHIVDVNKAIKKEAMNIEVLREDMTKYLDRNKKEYEKLTNDVRLEYQEDLKLTNEVMREVIQ